jgi:phosphoribosylamine--glycine ligase
VVLAARGYPDQVETGSPVRGLETLHGDTDVIVFHAATARRDGEVVTVGGRVLGITALAPGLEQAIQRAYDAVGKLSFDGMQYRRDIGRKALARMRAAH